VNSSTPTSTTGNRAWDNWRAGSSTAEQWCGGPGLVLEQTYDCDGDGEIDWTCRDANNTHSTVIKSSDGHDCRTNVNHDQNMNWTAHPLEEKCPVAAAALAKPTTVNPASVNATAANSTANSTANATADLTSLVQRSGASTLRIEDQPEAGGSEQDPEGEVLSLRKQAEEEDDCGEVLDGGLHVECWTGNDEPRATKHGWPRSHSLWQAEEFPNFTGISLQFHRNFRRWGIIWIFKKY
jgi:hypothetical protein